MAEDHEATTARHLPADGRAHIRRERGVSLERLWRGYYENDLVPSGRRFVGLGTSVHLRLAREPGVPAEFPESLREGAARLADRGPLDVVGKDVYKQRSIAIQTRAGRAVASGRGTGWLGPLKDGPVRQRLHFAHRAGGTAVTRTGQNGLALQQDRRTPCPRFLHAIRDLGIGLGRPFESTCRSTDVRWVKEQIAPGAERLHRRRPFVLRHRKPSHGQRIGDNETGEPETPAQQILEKRGIPRGRPLPVGFIPIHPARESRIGNVSSHDRIDYGRGLGEWGDVELQLCGRSRDDGKLEMRISQGAAVTRKVFRARSGTRRLTCLDPQPAQSPNADRVISEAPGADDRVGALQVQIQNRCQDPVESEAARFMARDPGGLPHCHLRLWMASQRSGRRKRRTPGELLPGAALQIGREPERSPGCFANLHQEIGCRRRIPSKQKKAADAQLERVERSPPNQVQWIVIETEGFDEEEGSRSGAHAGTHLPSILAPNAPVAQLRSTRILR